jgi:hypothetical protein
MGNTSKGDQTMILQAGYAICCLLQGLAAFFQIKDRLGEEGKMSPSKGRAAFIAAMLVVGAVVSAVFGVWTYDHPPQPKIVEKIITVDKPMPCPPAEQKTDHSSTKGNNSPVVTGNGNKFGGDIPHR